VPEMANAGPRAREIPKIPVHNADKKSRNLFSVLHGRSPE